MAGKTLIQVESPKTQSIDAVKALLTWRGRAADPLPSFVELGKEENRLVLVLSNKRDSYYTTTATACSCPAATFHHGPCKHQRKHFPEVKTATKPTASEPLIKRGGFRPFDEMPGERVKASSSFHVVDATPDATPREIAYQEMKMVREMWPAEA